MSIWPVGLTRASSRRKGLVACRLTLENAKSGRVPWSSSRRPAGQPSPSDDVPTDWDRRRKDSAREQPRYGRKVRSSTSTHIAPAIAKEEWSRTDHASADRSRRCPVEVRPYGQKQPD